MPATRLRVQRDSNSGRMPISTAKTTTPITDLTTRAALKGPVFSLSLVSIFLILPFYFMVSWNYIHGALSTAVVSSLAFFFQKLDYGLCGRQILACGLHVSLARRQILPLLQQLLEFGMQRRSQSCGQFLGAL